MLLLPTQGPARTPASSGLAPGILGWMSHVWGISEPASGAGAGPLRPSTAALLRSALGGRCLRIAVLVYGIGTLRVIDRGPSYGLPAALQTAGLALVSPGKDPCPDPAALGLMLRLFTSSTSLSPPGRGASVALALRTARAAAGSLFGEQLSPLNGISPVHRPAVPLPAGGGTYDLFLDALRCARLLTPAKDTTPRMTLQRREWWWLAWLDGASALRRGGR